MTSTIELRFLARLTEVAPQPKLLHASEQPVPVAILVKQYLPSENINELLIALNHTMTDASAVASPGDIVTLMPPVTGG